MIPNKSNKQNIHKQKLSAIKANKPPGGGLPYKKGGDARRTF